MPRTRILSAPPTQQGWFGTTTKNTGLSQRETLEEIMINLATLLGAEVIYKQTDSRGAYFYELQLPELSAFQSASNTILELSRRLSKKA